MARRRRPTLRAISENPTLHPAAFALTQARFPELKWHFFVDSPDSSQAFALSAFLPVLDFPDKDQILEEFVTTALPGLPRRTGRSWQVIPEYEEPRLLGETGRGESTKIDILLVADDAAVCVEAKFRVDARRGWGRCSQPPRLCAGFHGAGSDRKGSRAQCRLELPDGERAPRLYWRAGRRWFRPEAFVEQQPGETCPFSAEYQLVRNYLFAAEYALRVGAAGFGVIGVAPAANLGPLSSGVAQFTRGLLPPGQAGRVTAIAYERYVEILSEASPQARRLAAFLGALLDHRGPRLALPGAGTAESD